MDDYRELVKKLKDGFSKNPELLDDLNLPFDEFYTEPSVLFPSLPGILSKAALLKQLGSFSDFRHRLVQGPFEQLLRVGLHQEDDSLLRLLDQWIDRPFNISPSHALTTRTRARRVSLNPKAHNSASPDPPFLNEVIIRDERHLQLCKALQATNSLLDQYRLSAAWLLSHLGSLLRTWALGLESPTECLSSGLIDRCLRTGLIFRFRAPHITETPRDYVERMTQEFRERTVTVERMWTLLRKQILPERRRDDKKVRERAHWFLCYQAQNKSALDIAEELNLELDVSTVTRQIGAFAKEVNIELRPDKNPGRKKGAAKNPRRSI